MISQRENRIVKMIAAMAIKYLFKKKNKKWGSEQDQISKKLKVAQTVVKR